jgi:hypothetical protein
MIESTRRVIVLKAIGVSLQTCKNARTLGKCPSRENKRCWKPKNGCSRKRRGYFTSRHITSGPTHGRDTHHHQTHSRRNCASAVPSIDFFFSRPAPSSRSPHRPHRCCIPPYSLPPGHSSRQTPHRAGTADGSTAAGNGRQIQRRSNDLRYTYTWCLYRVNAVYT